MKFPIKNILIKYDQIHSFTIQLLMEKCIFCAAVPV